MDRVSLQSMVTKSPSKQRICRLVVYVSLSEYKAIARDADSLGLKNAHRWAASKLATDIRQTYERFR